jgi:hypothetical protein
MNMIARDAKKGEMNLITSMEESRHLAKDNLPVNLEETKTKEKDQLLLVFRFFDLGAPLSPA